MRRRPARPMSEPSSFVEPRLSPHLSQSRALVEFRRRGKMHPETGETSHLRWATAVRPRSERRTYRCTMSRPRCAIAFARFCPVRRRGVRNRARADVVSAAQHARETLGAFAERRGVGGGIAETQEAAFG